MNYHYQHPYTLDEVSVSTTRTTGLSANYRWAVVFRGTGKKEQKVYVGDEARANAVAAGAVIALEAAGYGLRVERERLAAVS